MTCLGFLVFLSFLIPSLASGAMVYESEASFLNKLSPSNYFNSFENSVPGDQGVTNATVSGGTPIFTVRASTDGTTNNNLYIVSGTLPSGQALSTATEATVLTLDFTSGNVTAIGANFFLSDLAENRVPGTLSIVLNDGTSNTVASSSSGPAAFRGFTSANPITSIKLRSASHYVTIDNLYVGSAAAAESTNRYTLSIRRVNSLQGEIAWPVVSTGDVLRSKPSLTSTQWTDVGGIGSPSNGLHRVLIDTGEPTRFFQLQRP